MNGQTIPHPYSSGLWLSVAVSILSAACCLSIFVPAGWVFAPIAALLLIAVPFFRPITVLGATLLIMPLHFLPVMVGQFFAVPYMTAISACTKEVPLLLVAFILYRKNGMRWALPDLLLLACFGIAILRTAFSGEVSGLLVDFEFLIAYFLGRLMVLTSDQERSWANIAVWTAALVSVLGVIEVLVLGDAPRRLLYAVVTREADLPDSFRATAFEGMRAASTLIGPPSLAAFCMIALIIWWVYSRKIIPGALIAAGLVASVTRSAWIGTAIAILVLAFRTHHVRRLLLFGAVAGALFLAAIPILGLSDYLFQARQGTDESTLVHRESELRGIQYAFEHPLGTGAGSVGAIALEKNRNAVVTENTYLAFAAQYGVLATLLFVAFLVATLHRAWSLTSPLAHVTVGFILAFGLMMTVLLMQNDFRLNCWVWFPLGLFIRTLSPEH